MARCNRSALASSATLIAPVGVDIIPRCAKRHVRLVITLAKSQSVAWQTINRTFLTMMTVIHYYQYDRNMTSRTKSVSVTENRIFSVPCRMSITPVLTCQPIKYNCFSIHHRSHTNEQAYEHTNGVRMCSEHHFRRNRLGIILRILIRARSLGAAMQLRARSFGKHAAV